jgi:hypothetical protein
MKKSASSSRTRQEDQSNTGSGACAGTDQAAPRQVHTEESQKKEPKNAGFKGKARSSSSTKSPKSRGGGGGHDQMIE